MSKSRILFVVFAVSLASSSAVENENEPYKVVFVNVLHRHGARTPAYFYPNDPYQNASYWPVPMGQMTNLGKQQVFELGQWLHKRYSDLLTDHYSPDLIYVQSTDKDRTLMSADCLLAGMYPPEGAQIWRENLTWQPIPVHTRPLFLDAVLAQPPRSPCPAYEEELYRVFATDEKIKQLNQTYADLLKWTNDNLGTNFDLLTLYNLYDTLYIESLHNLTLPAWTTKVFPEPMREANVFNYMIVTWTPKLARLMNGLLVQEMISNMMEKAQNKTTRNLHVYTAHDETIANLLNTLGAFNHALPPYAACVMMELQVDTKGSYFVSLYYRNSTTEDPYLLTVAGCSPLCPLDQFINITRPVIPEDWNAECDVSRSNGHQDFWSDYKIRLYLLVFIYYIFNRY
ncbi:prostatic acid phosphatase-like [Macrosteles quadrilineatus]|uniref:prostatic acid phosphatase-like n=1 Tax=Macrosteles quadrilineatus TaxID=74068 RepID=UPI0023E10C0E|nr:prostatic acid phosphatase-like [Macrosteles quadrilineatus]